MASMAEAGMLDEIDPWYWVYLAGFILSCTLGILVQCNTLKKKKEKMKKEQTEGQDGVDENVDDDDASGELSGSGELEAPLVAADDADKEAEEDDHPNSSQGEDNSEDQEGSESSEALAIEFKNHEEIVNEQDQSN